MYRTFEAVYSGGHIVPLEEIDADEYSKLLVIVLDSQPKSSISNNWKNLKGKYKNSLSSVDEFISHKQEEKKLDI